MASGSGKGHFNPRSPHGERRHLYGDLSRLWHFNPRSPHGERRDGSSLSIIDFVFQPTLPARGATRAAPRPLGHPVISTHAPRTGSDDTPQGYMMALSDFNPRSPHGERRFTCNVGRIACDISIHAPRTGSDERLAALSDMLEISIHAPRTGSDSKIFTFRIAQILFQSTLPARGATRCPMIQAMVVDHFNPRSPHGERRA